MVWPAAPGNFRRTCRAEHTARECSMASGDARAKRLVEYFITVGVGEDVQPMETSSGRYLIACYIIIGELSLIRFDCVLQSSSERNRAITDIRVIAEDAELPLGYEVLQSTMFGADARLNRGVWSLTESRFYLCVSREAPGAPITDVILIFGDEGELCPSGAWYF